MIVLFGADYGNQPVETFMQDCENWVLSRAKVFSYSNPSRVDDVAQEGRITLWKEYEKHSDKEPPVRIAISMKAAKYKMMAVAGETRNGQMTGHTGQPGHIEAKSSVYLDSPVGEDGNVTLMDFLVAVDFLSDVEVAYHHGEIAEAISSLTPYQQKYIYARFWCGMDGSDGMGNVTGVREARANNPYLKRDVLWTGNGSGAKGAKKILAEKLAHLHALVRT